MEFFLQGLDYQIWSIVEEGDLLVTNEKDKWTEDDRKKISLNCKAKSILCCALSKKEFNRISACKSAMEMWEKLRITYEGTDRVKETKIDILVTQYERFQMQSGESITQMYSRFTDITNRLASLGKTYEMGDMLKKTEFRKKDSSKKFRRYKKKAMAAAWDNTSDSDSESSSSGEEEEKANLAFMANIDEKVTTEDPVTMGLMSQRPCRARLFVASASSVASSAVREKLAWTFFLSSGRLENKSCS
ncbi:hypothetical protein Taro_056163 [Colocasia esculenta]|uniref:Gag-pol polyprotein n=1 Tax=Colocasia esculenta TaxID=4460 RepID=A0A843XVP1_COLES|nr:hypothetical protein [Colocasia esculenta]